MLMSMCYSMQQSYTMGKLKQRMKYGKARK